MESPKTEAVKTPKKKSTEVATTSPPKKKKSSKRKNDNDQKQLQQQQQGDVATNNIADSDYSSSLIRSLSLLDPLLQFLTRATGQTVVPLSNLLNTIPKKVPYDDLLTLLEYGIIQIQATPITSSSNTTREQVEKDNTNVETNTVSCWKEDLKNDWNRKCPVSGGDTSPSDSSRRHTFKIGFPSGDSSEVNRKLCGSTKTAAKRRMTALKQKIKQEQQKERNTTHGNHKNNTNHEEAELASMTITNDDTLEYSPIDEGRIATAETTKDWTLPTVEENDVSLAKKDEEEKPLSMEQQARSALKDVLGLCPTREPEKGQLDGGDNNIVPSATVLVPNNIPSSILPQQISYAGSHSAQTAEYETNPSWKTALHPDILKAFLGERDFYKHQALAINSALRCRHTLVCTGTGSGKSLCFWIPILQKALSENRKSLVLFPTKALAQDQLVKLQGIVEDHPGLRKSIRAATLDGDTPHSQRLNIAKDCNIILTNPDTLHAAILPNWNTMYKDLLQDLQYLVIDEAHMYEGVFGAHVAMIIARLYRIHCCSVSSGKDALPLVFLACSATLVHPEHHFRLLCCIPSTQSVTVLTEDFSPRAAKHFFVWNPPLLDENGKSLGYVMWPKKKKSGSKGKKEQLSQTLPSSKSVAPPYDGPVELSSEASEVIEKNNLRRKDVRRRHSADETALLLARAVTEGVRCIAFCKTRCLVEWVYERCISTLKQSPTTAHLVSKVDSYRGGYTKMKRREIEEKLFNNQLLGVVGTSALELGVDIGGVEITLHCGFPSSHASLMQQAGRAGRGAAACQSQSLAICVCFNGPVDQHLWRHPSSLLQRGVTAPLSMPIYPGLVKGHLLCAGQEFPLTGKLNVTAVQSVEDSPKRSLLSDEALFGSAEVYQEALENLISNGSMCEGKLPVFGGKAVSAFKTHPSIKNTWTKVSIRSIENINYDIVDISHPMQANRMDGCHNEAAVLVSSVSKDKVYCIVNDSLALILY